MIRYNMDEYEMRKAYKKYKRKYREARFAQYAGADEESPEKRLARRQEELLRRANAETNQYEIQQQIARALGVDAKCLARMKKDCHKDLKDETWDECKDKSGNDVDPKLICSTYLA
jgi:hypothetical protein